MSDEPDFLHAMLEAMYTLLPTAIAQYPDEALDRLTAILHDEWTRRERGIWQLIETPT